MAAKDEQKVVDKEKDWVEVHVPKTFANDDPSFFVSINGKNYNLPRGKRVKVPPEVAEEVRRAERAQERYEQTASERELK